MSDHFPPRRHHRCRSTHRRPGRIAVVAALALPVALALAGCGGGSSASSPSLEQASERTTTSGTAHFTVAAVAATGGQSIAENGQGDVDFAGHRVTTTSARPALGSDADVKDTQIVIGDDVWLSVPGSLARKVPGAKPFAHSTVQAESADVAAALSRPANPLQLLAELKGVDPASVKRLGTARLRGATTTHYAAQLDLVTGAGSDPTARATAAGVAAMSGTARVPVEVWIDHRDRVRRLQVTLHNLKLTTAPDAAASGDGPPGGSGGSIGGVGPSGQMGADLPVDVTLTTDLFDFGVPVAITAPPPDQVMEASALG